MDLEFWRARWEEPGQGFDQPAPNPHLVRWLDRLVEGAERPRRVLVPLAGKSRDVAWLAAPDQAARPIAIEFVPRAIERFFAEHGVPPAVTREAGCDVYRGGAVTFYAADLFAVTPSMTGRVGAIYDRGSLVAMPKAEQRRYVEHVSSFLSPGGRVLLIAVDHDGTDGKPPFATPPAEIEALYGARFGVEKLFDEDVLEANPRFRARGITWFREQVYLLSWLEA